MKILKKIKFWFMNHKNSKPRKRFTVRGFKLFPELWKLEGE
jgi:hypothetical protein